MRTTYVALLSGTLFGAGLAVAQMTNPAKVLSFLDITGDWDPSLAFVMGTALLVSTVAYRVPRRSEPVGSHSSIGVPAEPFSLAGIDKQLVGGAALFGVGWGLAGFCPGPALAALASGSGQVVVFASAMVAGMGLFHLMTRVGPNASKGSDG